MFNLWLKNSSSMLTKLITARKAAQRNASLDAHCRELSAAELLAECAELDAFRRRADNLYERVRALFFLYAKFSNQFFKHLPTSD